MCMCKNIIYIYIIHLSNNHEAGWPLEDPVPDRFPSLMVAEMETTDKRGRW